MVDHHWLVYEKDEEFVPNLDKFGFVYLITNLQSGKGYIGCKQYKLYTKLKERESDWKTYTGSSKWLNEDIKKIGKEHFKFEIIAEYKNKRSLRYYELYYQMKFNVLSSTIEGTDEPAYYNSRVGGKFYRPVESYQDPEFKKKLSNSLKNSETFQKSRKDPEYKKKLSKAQKKRFEDPEYRKKMGEREFYKDPEYKKKQSEIQKKRLEDPENRKKNKIILDKNRNTKKDPVTGRFIKRNVQAQEK
tara:strand:- start:929 stop:1663 length:735 start_codon:yes stop_codon:yes gene_type:complete